MQGSRILKRLEQPPEYRQIAREPLKWTQRPCNLTLDCILTLSVIADDHTFLSKSIDVFCL